jgi:protein involved in polysaccharide export with SLBB domain
MRAKLAFATVLTAICTLTAAAQSSPVWDPTGLQLTRAELQELLTRYEETSASSAYSGRLREQARAEAALIRHRLDEGDLNVGDRLVIDVYGQEALTDTFTVVAGRQVVLPDLGPIPVSGILRSELQEHMEQQIGRFIRNPIVRTRSLVRVEILGAVGSPGFFTIPSDILLTEALMIAGGPGALAQLDKVRIERGRNIIWDGDATRAAMIEGRTLDQLSIRAGDSILVPARAEGRLRRMREVFYVIGGISSLIAIATQVF